MLNWSVWTPRAISPEEQTALAVGKLDIPSITLARTREKTRVPKKVCILYEIVQEGAEVAIENHRKHLLLYRSPSSTTLTKVPSGTRTTIIRIQHRAHMTPALTLVETSNFPNVANSPLELCFPHDVDTHRKAFTAVSDMMEVSVRMKHDMSSLQNL